MQQPAESEIEAIFRRESGRLISVLTRLFGPHNLKLDPEVARVVGHDRERRLRRATRPVTAA